MDLKQLQEIIANIMDVDADEITLETSFDDDLGCDSLDKAEIIMACEDELDIQMTDDFSKDIVTVGDALNEINKFLHE